MRAQILRSLNPQTSKSPNPQIPRSPNPQILKSLNPQIPRSSNPQILKSPDPQIPRSPNPQIPKSPDPQIPRSSNPQILKSPNPQIKYPQVYSEFLPVFYMVCFVFLRFLLKLDHPDKKKVLFSDIYCLSGPVCNLCLLFPKHTEV